MLDFIWTLPVQLWGTRNKWTLQKILIHGRIRTSNSGTFCFPACTSNPSATETVDDLILELLQYLLTLRYYKNSHNGGRNQVSGRVSVPCWHATPVKNAPWKPLTIGEGQARYKDRDIGGKSDWLGSNCWSRIRMSFNILERDTSYCWIRSPYRQ